MTNKYQHEHVKEMLPLIEKYTEKLRNDKELSTQFLRDLGMLTKSGKLKRIYKVPKDGK